jgi:hypothetical protein
MAHADARAAAGWPCWRRPRAERQQDALQHDDGAASIRCGPRVAFQNAVTSPRIVALVSDTGVQLEHRAI